MPLRKRGPDPTTQTRRRPAPRARADELMPGERNYSGLRGELQCLRSKEAHPRVLVEALGLRLVGKRRAVRERQGGRAQAGYSLLEPVEAGTGQQPGAHPLGGQVELFRRDGVLVEGDHSRQATGRELVPPGPLGRPVCPLERVIVASGGAPHPEGLDGVEVGVEHHDLLIRLGEEVARRILKGASVGDQVRGGVPLLDQHQRLNTLCEVGTPRSGPA